VRFSEIVQGSINRFHFCVQVLVSSQVNKSTCIMSIFQIQI